MAVHEAVNLAATLRGVSEYWSPEVVGLVNGNKLQVVKVLGAFDWHRHDDTDECFVVLRGQLTIDLRDGSVSLGAGELFVVPQAAEHRPRATAECQALVIATNPAPAALRAQAQQRL